MRNTRSRFSRVGIAAVALAPALAFAPVAGADEAESSAPSSSEDAASSLPGSEAEDAEATDNGNENDAPENGDENDGDEDAAGSVEGSLPEDIDTDELASSVADTDWTRVAKVIASLATGNVSIDTILDIIALSNDGDATVGDVIGSVTDVVGGSSDEGEDADEGEDGEDAENAENAENGDDSDDADSEAPGEDAAE